MAVQVRVLKQRVKSVKGIQKTTKAQQMIATSRIAKAQARVAASKPYSEQITEALAALATASTLDNPLLVERPNARRAGILIVTSDRGLCGGYNSGAIKTAEELAALLREQGKEPVLYVIGRKGLAYYTFRQKPVAASWTGFSEKPTHADAVRAAELLLPAVMAGSDGTTENGEQGIDELHVVSTQFVSMITQRPVASRVAPLKVEHVPLDAPPGPLPAYEFEPGSDVLLDALLPRYVTTRIYAALLDSAASESAARRQACQSASDNAQEVIRKLDRLANQARQAQITQELSEIVGGADALAAATSAEDE